MISETSSTKLDKKKKNWILCVFLVEFPWNNPDLNNISIESTDHDSTLHHRRINPLRKAYISCL